MFENQNVAPKLSSTALERLFPMPIFRCQITGAEGLNEQLKAVILARKEQGPGIVRSNQLGWHSELNLHTWPEECVQRLMGLVQNAATEFVQAIAGGNGSDFKLDPDGWSLEAWANVNPSGASNRKHTHDTKNGIILSSFYYVDTGKPCAEEWAGNTWFEDRDTLPEHYQFEPDIFSGSAFSRIVDNQPKLGELILFPSWLPHGVREYRGEGERVSIAINLWHRDIAFTKTTDKPTPEWAWKYFPKLMSALKRLKNKLR